MENNQTDHIPEVGKKVTEGESLISEFVGVVSNDGDFDTFFGLIRKSKVDHLKEVGGNISMSLDVPKKFAEAVKELHKAFNVELNEYINHKNNWIKIVVEGSMKNIHMLFKECQKNHNKTDWDQY